MPAAYQGTILRGGESPILNLNTPKGVSGEQQQATVDFINQLNRENLPPGEEDSELAARIAAELAARGHEFRTGAGETLPGIGLLDLTTVGGPTRLIGNIAIEVSRSTFRSDRYTLWVPLTPGAHTIRLAGRLASAETVQLAFPQKPRVIDVTARAAADRDLLAAVQK